MKNRFLFLVGIGALLAMSSCSKDEENLVVKSGEPATLSLNLKGSSVDTRVVGTLTGEEDNTISTVVVGVFRNDGNALDGLADAIENVTVNSGLVSTKVKCTAGSRDIIVVANASGTDYDLLKTATTKAQFLATILNLSDKGQSSSKVLMTGNAQFDLVAGDNSKPINVTRLVARVQLTSLKCSFTKSYANAVLEVDKIFLHNALFYYSVDGTAPVSPVFRTGYDLVTPASLLDTNLKDVISTPYSLAGDGGNEYLTKNHYFYTFPNGLTTPTKLVISGKFYPNGTSGAFNYVYYPIDVNKDQVYTGTPPVLVPNTGVGILRNTIYSISAKIFRPGVTDPDKPLDPASISLTITVTPWNKITQDNEL